MSLKHGRVKVGNGCTRGCDYRSRKSAGQPHTEGLESERALIEANVKLNVPGLRQLPRRDGERLRSSAGCQEYVVYSVSR